MCHLMIQQYRSIFGGQSFTTSIERVTKSKNTPPHTPTTIRFWSDPTSPLVYK